MIDSKIAAVLRGDTVGEFVVAVTLPGTPERFTRTFSGRITIGRGEDVDLQLSHPLVSRRHVELALRDDGIFEVRDLGSRNGTTVNDETLAEGVLKAEGEVRIQVGPYLLLVGPPADTISETLAFDVPGRARRVSLDRGKHSLTVDGKIAIEKLTGLEYGLLEALSDLSGDLVTNTSLGDRLWGKGQWDTYMLHNLVRRVRRKVEESGENGDDVIVTVPGVGYRLT